MESIKFPPIIFASTVSLLAPSCTLAHNICIWTLLPFSGAHSMASLVCVEDEEGNHEGEKTSSFGEGKTKNGVGEKLTCFMSRLIRTDPESARVRARE